jgi:LPPG:FO 2-phospho-L-lactate transferase
MSRDGASYVALSGGVGGAKLSLGLAHMLGARLTVIANTGDDFEHLGLYISPDVDTTLYTLAGVVNPQTGWGRRDETWSFMKAISDLGGPAWFNLGDKDLATHVERTRRLGSGEKLTPITAHLAQRFDIAARILPMADEPVRTILETDAGTLAFQEYFVRHRCRPMVRSLRYEGAAGARVTPQVRRALSHPALAGIFICPSNPWLSIDPVLAIPGMRDALKASGAPIIAVSPIVAGRALKGPTAKIMAELGLAPDVRSIAQHYVDLLDGLIVDTADEKITAGLPMRATSANAVMHSFDDKVALAAQCLAFCESLVRSERSVASGRRAGAGR